MVERLARSAAIQASDREKARRYTKHIRPRALESRRLPARRLFRRPSTRTLNCPQLRGPTNKDCLRVTCGRTGEGLTVLELQTYRDSDTYHLAYSNNFGDSSLSSHPFMYKTANLQFFI